MLDTSKEFHAESAIYGPHILERHRAPAELPFEQIHEFEWPDFKCPFFAP
jgi:hypothetical protein